MSGRTTWLDDEMVTSLSVLFCTLAYGPTARGGAEQQAALQAEELARRGVSVEVVCPRRQGSVEGLVNGVYVRNLPCLNVRFLATATYLLALMAFIARNGSRFQVFHVHLAYLQAEPVVAMGRLLRRPVWVKIAASGALGEIARMRRFAKLTRYYGIRRATVVQAISGAVASELASIGVPCERIRRIPNGVRVGRPSAAPPEESRPARRPVVVVYVGRFAQNKGIEDLVAAWRLIFRPGMELRLVGRGKTSNAVGGGLEGEGIVVLDWQENTEVVYRSSDVFVLPSRHSEGMSNALLEAMAFGLAVIATDVGAASELVEDGRTGMLVPAGDVDALAECLKALIDDRGGLRKRLGVAARAHVAQQYAIDRVVDQILDGYQAAIASV